MAIRTNSSENKEKHYCNIISSWRGKVNRPEEERKENEAALRAV